MSGTRRIGTADRIRAMSVGDTLRLRDQRQAERYCIEAQRLRRRDGCPVLSRWYEAGVYVVKRVA
jgi:hypothetical protein